MKKFLPKVSVIVPVYNVEEYLERCLESLINQTLKDIEIICVNDCSTDNSYDILKRFEAADERIKLINLDVNSGAAVARNQGLDAACGEYLGFVDSDDCVEPEFFEKLYNKAVLSGADIVKGNSKEITLTGEICQSNVNEHIKKYRSKIWFLSCWWSAIYKSEFIKENNIKFPEECPKAQDIVFLNKAVLNSNKIELVDDVFYKYFRRESSLDSKKIPVKFIQSAARAYEIVFSDINDAFTNNRISKSDYINLFFKRFDRFIKVTFQNDEISCKTFCAEKLINFYQDCKFTNDLDRLITDKGYGCIIESLKNFSVDSLTAILLKFTSSTQLERAGILAILRKNIKKDSSPKISVIIPVYNVEAYLLRCIESMINQTLSDIEIICVNDCSTDNSLEIIKSYASRDSRIKVINFDENKGVAVARNSGIESARGEYLAFCDSDDFVDADYYEKLYTAAATCGVDMAIGDYDCIVQNGNPYHYNDLEKVRQNKFNLFFHQTAIYKKSLVQKQEIIFPPGHLRSQDLPFMVKALYYSEKVKVIDSESRYHYCRRGDSASSAPRSEAHTYYCIKSICEIFKFLSDKEIPVDDFSILFKKHFCHALEAFVKSPEAMQKNLKNVVTELYSYVKMKDFKIGENIENIFFYLAKDDYENLRVASKIWLKNRLRDSLPDIKRAFMQRKRMEVNV